MTTRLPDWLARRADLMPDAPALIAGELRWSFADLHRAANAAAARLRGFEVEAGQRVASLMGSNPGFVALLHAMPRVGTSCVPLNTRLTPPELVWQIGHCRAPLVLYDQAHAATIEQIRAQLPAVRFELWRPFVDRAELEAAPESSRLIELEAIQSIIYTSGTTGNPKGAMISYANHWWSANASALNLGLLPNDCWLAILPLFHVGGMSILMRSVIYGQKVVLLERFDAGAANRLIDSEGVTIVSVVATTLQRMLEERGQRAYPSHLRCMLLGGGPAPRPLLEACAARALPVVQTYGMTETASQAVTLAPADALRKLGSAGKPLLPLELRIDAPPLQAGEILLRGPMVCAGYVDDPEATAAAIRDGWLHTGDIGRLDEEGYLYLLDRRSDLIISGGENIYPAELEAALLAHPGVAEAGVVGVPDQEWGQVPVAFVVARQPAQVESLLAELPNFLSERLARYKLPRRYFVASELPRTASGKLRRNVLRRQLEKGIA